MILCDSLADSVHLIQSPTVRSDKGWTRIVLMQSSRKAKTKELMFGPGEVLQEFLHVVTIADIPPDSNPRYRNNDIGIEREFVDELEMV